MSRSRGTHLRRLPPDPARNRVAVGEEVYQWELRHGWGTTAEGVNCGLSVSVWAQRHQTRELILDFSFNRFGAKTPLEEEMLEALQEAIAFAIGAGWKPDSRGRRFRIDVPEAGILYKTPVQ